MLFGHRSHSTLRRPCLDARSGARALDGTTSVRDSLTRRDHRLSVCLGE
jgi:hypothetical protein